MQGLLGLDENGELSSARPRLVRAVTNDEDEYTYKNLAASGGDVVYSYGGGNKVLATVITEEGNGYTEGGFVTTSNTAESLTFENAATWEFEGESEQSNSNRRIALSKTDAASKVVEHTRNPITQSPLSGTQSDGFNKTASYNNFNQPLLSTDTLDRVTNNTYDVVGNLVSSTRGFGSDDASTMTYVYNGRGQIVESIDALYDTDQPDLHNTQYVYDATGYLIEKIESADLAGGPRPKTVYAYNAIGLVTSSTDQEGRLTEYAYDFYNRLVRTTYNDTSTEIIEYGAAGSGKENLVISMTDRNGILTSYDYDLADRKVETRIADGTPEVSVENCTYLTGTLRKQTCTLNGETVTYLFDNRNRVVGMSTQAYAETELITNVEHDELSRRRSTTDAYGRSTYYLYDQNDRIYRTVTETVPGGVGNIPDFVNGSSQTSSNFTFVLRDKDGTELRTTNTHKVEYTDPRDSFLADLNRNELGVNAPYTVVDTVYDSAGQMVIRTDARGIETWNEYDELGRTTLTINAVGAPEEIRMESDYDDNSNMIASRSPRYFSEGEGSDLDEQSLGLGVDIYNFNGRNLRASHTTAAGSDIEATQSWTYFLDARSETHTDFRGNVMSQLWHECCGRLQASIQQDGISATIHNTDFRGLSTHTATVTNFDVANVNYHNPNDADTLAETTTRFDGRGRPTFTTKWLTPQGEIEDTARANLGNGVIPIAGLDGVSSTDGLTMSYEYDEDLTDGIGIDADYATQLAALTARYGYNPFAAGSNGFAVAMTNPENETTVQIKDGAGRTILNINGEGDITTMDYDTVATIDVTNNDLTITGDLLATSSTDANGNTNTSYTDGAGRALASEDAIGNFSITGYDNNSNVVITRDPIGLGQNCEFDELNRDISCADLQEQSEGTSRSKAYNAASQVVSSINADDEEISNIYDERNRMISSTDGNEITTGYAYDANNNLITLTDGKGEDRQWFYDERNLVTTKTYPSTTGNDFYTTSYDALRRPVVKTDQLNDTCTSIYDLASRMTSKEYRTGGTTLESTDTFVYDGASRMISCTKGRYNITTEHSYADDSMPLTETLIADGRNYISTRSYDPANRPITHTYPSGETTTWVYDKRNLVDSVYYEGDVRITRNRYDDNYRIRKQKFQNGLLHNIIYGRLDNLRTRDNVRSTIDLDMRYDYDADKQIVSETIAEGVLQDTSFTANYDGGNRITSWSRPGNNPVTNNQTWNYDDAGNWNNTSKTVGNQTTTEARNHNAADEITSIAGEATQSDAKGNLTEFEINGKEYDVVNYDLDNRINKVDVDGTDVEYRYDAMGRRVLRKVGNTTTALIWWANSEYAEHEHRAGQTVIQNDIFDHPTRLNAVVARAVNGSKFEIQWYHKNYLDHVYAVSDDSGDILEHYRYTAFGEVTIYDSTGAIRNETQIDNDILWNTRRLDPVSGFYLYKYRHYAPELGRWLGRDPIEENGGVNLYQFCYNNPIGYIDIYGNWAWFYAVPGVGQIALVATAVVLLADVAINQENSIIGRAINGIGDIPIPEIPALPDILPKPDVNPIPRVDDIPKPIPIPVPPAPAPRGQVCPLVGLKPVGAGYMCVYECPDGQIRQRTPANNDDNEDCCPLKFIIVARR